MTAIPPHSPTDDLEHQNAPSRLDERDGARSLEAFIPMVLGVLASLGLIIFAGSMLLSGGAGDDDTEVATTEASGQDTLQTGDVAPVAGPTEKPARVLGGLEESNNAQDPDPTATSTPVSTTESQSEAVLPEPTLTARLAPTSSATAQPDQRNPALPSRNCPLPPPTRQSGDTRQFAPTYIDLDRDGVEEIIAVSNIARASSFAVLHHEGDCNLANIGQVSSTYSAGYPSGWCVHFAEEEVVVIQLGGAPDGDGHEWDSVVYAMQGSDFVEVDNSSGYTDTPWEEFASLIYLPEPWCEDFSWLKVDGIADFEFVDGISMDTAIDHFDRIYGDPVSLRSNVSCSGGADAVVSWRGLQLLFTDDRLTGWSDEGSAPGLRTPSGVHVGMAEVDMAFIYETADYHDAAAGTVFDFEVPSGVMSGLLLNGEVASLHAGDSC